MQSADRGHAPPLRGAGLHIGIVQSRYHAQITDSLAAHCRAELLALGVDGKHVKLVCVPGAFEIALAASAMAESDNFDALIALGCVVRGETYQFEVVAHEAASGISRVALDHQLPVVNGLLAVETLEQASVRSEDTGRHSARVAVEMANLMDELS